MAQASDGNGDMNNIHTGDAATPKASSLLQKVRHPLPIIATRGREPNCTPPPKLLHEKLAGGDGGEGGVGGDGRGQTAADAPHIPDGPEGGVEDGRSDGGGGEGGGDSGSGGATDAAAAAAVAAAAAALSAAVETSDAAADHNADLEPPTGKQAEEHLSCKYTKEEILARHWGMNLQQMKRVKALLRMGVCEEDLEIADRLLKMGRDISNDTPLTKEEQLLGYTLVQRQRMKALHILGLTEESFERCRAVMLSSLGPSAFGYTADETAKSAARAEAEEGWTPGDKFRRKGPGQDGGGLHSNLLRMPTFGHHISQHHPHIGNFGGNVSTKKFPNSHLGGGLGESGRIRSVQQTRRASDSDKGGYLPDVITAKRKARGAGGGAVAIAMPPLETIVGSRVNSSPGISTPLSTSSDPR